MGRNVMLILKRLALSFALAAAPFVIGLIGSAARPQADSPPPFESPLTDASGPAGAAAVRAGWFGPGPHPGGPGGPERLCRDAKALLNGYLSYLETKLALTDAQKADWQSFAGAVRSAAEPLEQVCTAPPPKADPVDPVEAIKAREAPVIALAKSLSLFHAAAEKFVPVLTAEQKRAFTQALPGRIPPFAPPPPDGARP